MPRRTVFGLSVAIDGTIVVGIWQRRHGLGLHLPHDRRRRHIRPGGQAVGLRRRSTHDEFGYWHVWSGPIDHCCGRLRLARRWRLGLRLRSFLLLRRIPTFTGAPTRTSKSNSHQLLPRLAVARQRCDNWSTVATPEPTAPTAATILLATILICVAAAIVCACGSMWSPFAPVPPPPIQRSSARSTDGWSTSTRDK